ncbi:hypothetical protein RIF23_17460 [Lipingzhangella sp. LS1_29]|uniref:Uncharacterized protein n=1 Tax=Lipingzhangella rawalii TaxID=2055835 RepID=A0ABU2H9S8_9ACTN|nr:hypothetical protein [Lipingzhangella rawalii]MDS1272080.1 hypothetical protein [Lipingzhangella rawalii]
MQETVASALAQLSRTDPRVAQTAEHALSTLTAGEGLAGLNQRTVQKFCWQVLPARYASSAEEQEFVVRSLGELFQLLGLSRYAEICTSAATQEILAAHQRGSDTGNAAFERHMRASGVEPPDLSELTWGTALGSAEIEAYDATSAALELAIALGDVQPGTTGWRTAQERQARAFLTQPDDQGRSRLDKIREERVRAWLSSAGHPHRQHLVPLLGQIIAGADPPHSAHAALSPVQRLLEFASDGIALTQIGYLSPNVVREMCTEFDWTPVSTPPRSETDVTQIITLHKLLRSMRAVRRSGRRLILTRRGRRLRDSTESLWVAVAESVLNTDGFEQAATETLLGLLLVWSPRSTGSHSSESAVDIAAEARTILADAGWEKDTPRHGQRQSPVDSVLITVAWLLETLGCVSRVGLMHEQPTLTLTKVGRAFALTAFHLSATTPRASL